MQPSYQQATPAEITFYQEHLYPLQDEVMKIAAIYGDKIYLTGGTALARFHFHHRLSEDLDFFVQSVTIQAASNLTGTCCTEMVRL
jgi:hypothetical protein